MNRYLLTIPAAVILGTLTLNLFFWGMCWLVEKPFDYLGWDRMVVDWFDYSQATIRMDYVMQTIMGVIVSGIHVAAIYWSYIIIKTKADRHE